MSRREIHEIKGSANTRAVLFSFIIFSTRTALALTVIAYVVSGSIITAEKIFLLTSFYNVLRQSFTVFFPSAITQVAEALISIKRIQKFLMYEEIPRNNVPSLTLNGIAVSEKGSKEPGIKFEKASFKWLISSTDSTLSNITLSVPKGQLLAVIGPVGSGKSSLLQAILREIPITSGNLEMNGCISYASQEPWLFAATVRQNILFGSHYDKMRYRRVIDVCALKRDFELFPFGDQTLVGERGVSLSGGQRARINLARAIYKEADIYLLDDPLSAVDTHVGKHLFEDCVAGFLRQKTVILVTHQLQYLNHVEHIVILNNGKIESEGSFDDLERSGLNFAKLLHQSHGQENEDDHSSITFSRKESITSTATHATEEPKEEQKVAEETRQKGSVGLSVYNSYFKACKSWLLCIFVFSLFLGTQITASFVDYWGSKMSEDEEKNFANMNMTDEERLSIRNENVYIFSGINVAMIVITVARSLLFFTLARRISQNMHDAMFRRIARAPMKFFNNNPSGRILNRFSKDIGAIDELLPQAMIDCIQIFLTLFAIVILVAILSPFLLIPTFFISVILYLLRMVYLQTSRSIKRLEGTTRSPVFSHLSASLQGLITIRAFGAEEILTAEFDSYQDLHSSAWYIFLGGSRAFGFWLDFFCCIYITLVCFSFIFWEVGTGANAGLAITQSLGLTGMFQWGMRQSAEVENQMTAVERIDEYTNLEQEPEVDNSSKPPPNWPAKGAISFDHVVVRYDLLADPVLHQISFNILPQEKIGIVGRTGAGKSTLIAAIFRLAYIEGKITIDSVDTSTIQLHDLRSKISIIPQEPVLFSGTLRKNLDPFDEYPDWMLWNALSEVELKEVIRETHDGLHGLISEGGSNFSVGQRQLICLARAILRNNRILIMDEATANVDPQTDKLIQRTIRHKFTDCTVLTIAHRLNTVMDSDRILVMDSGYMVEMDHPYVLLSDTTSSLSGLIEQTGRSTSQRLKNIAKKNYKLKLRREEALRMLREVAAADDDDDDDDTSQSSRSSSPDIFQQAAPKAQPEDTRL